ncbi:ligand-binding sensor domain-containing protein [Aliikangiella coralliicola]|uniref:Diguanylate cyclase n=1 Tax=Aliikangiella coralliicola TaxID=2592383 RepID=A0A545UDB9_9GAMM|nr:ligand-binding sensor domain-containing diguanylate cyclase [Aliikangiella coralliicola]TQV87458.1 diguanylate cyclase [Aliikangiella coralliicola]
MGIIRASDFNKQVITIQLVKKLVGRATFLVFGCYLLFITDLQSRPNSLPFSRLTDEQGLPSNEIITSLQDRYGYMWFGTSAGLSRFDGYEFVNFRHDPQDPGSLLADKIWALYEDNQGILWIGTEFGGLNRYDPDTGQFTAYIHDPSNKHSISHNYVREIRPAKNNKLWIGTSGGGLNLFDPKKGQFKHFQHSASDPTGISGNYIRALKVDADGGLWIGLRFNGLNYLSPDGKFTHFRHQPGDDNQISSDMVQSLLLTKDNELFVGTWDTGLNRLDINSGEWMQFKNATQESASIGEDAIVSLLQTDSGDIWMGTITNGLYHFDKRLQKFSVYQNYPADIQSIPFGGVYTLTQDHQGFIWAGTWGGGVAKVNPRASQLVRHRHLPGDSGSLAYGSAEGVAVDYQGTLWVGIEGGGLNALEKNQDQFIRFSHDPGNPESLSDNDVEVVYQDPFEPETLWIGTRFGGVNQFNINTRKVVRYLSQGNEKSDLSGNDVRAIYRDRNGILWVGTTNGLNQIDLKEWEVIQYRHDPDNHQSISHDSIYVIFEDSQSNIWIGTSGGGLNRIDQNKKSFATYKHESDNPRSLSHNMIWDIIEDNKNQLWISTGRGLNRLIDKNTSPKNAQFEYFGKQKLVSLLIDNENKFWISAQKGIYRFDPDSGNFKLFGTADGALSRHSYPAKFKDTEGNFYFGGYDGVTKFNPKSLSDHNEQSRVLFSELVFYNQIISSDDETSILSRRIEDTETLQIPYNEPVFSLRYSARDYSLMDNVVYRYKLHGFDSKWTETKLNSLTYTNLDPGEYQLEIKASDKDGVWSQKVTRLNIVIDPPPWRTFWAYTLYVLSFMGLIRYYLHSQKRKLAYEALKKISLTDQLTGLKNRYFVDKYIQDDVEWCLRKYQNLSRQEEHYNSNHSDLIFYLIDIDHFKRINDQYGHKVGDIVLKQMRQRLEKVFRKSDYLVRWGGEEFLVIARFTGRENAAEIAERFRRAVAMQDFNVSDEISLQITCSLGFVPFPVITSSPTLISWNKTLELADHCLYAAKHTQRNAWVGMAGFESSDSGDLSFSLLRHHTAQLIANQKLKIVTSISGDSRISWDW